MTLRFNRSPRGEKNMTLIENIALQNKKQKNKNGTITKQKRKCCEREINIKHPLKKHVFFFQDYMIQIK